MRLLLVYPPTCAPTVMPYSLSALKGLLRLNSDIQVSCLDLNAMFHRLRFREHYERLGKEDIASVLESFDKESRPVYAENNRAVVEGLEPELLHELLEEIRKRKPTHVAFSIVYNSQNFYAKSLIDNLGVTCFSGGPAVSGPVREQTAYYQDGQSFLSALGVVVSSLAPPDFSDFDPKDYLAERMVYPAKASQGCPYARCVFCTHHNGEAYMESPLGPFFPGQDYYFIDDMIPAKRALAISALMKGNRWSAHLRPTREILPHLAGLAASGLRCAAWGVESGCQETLDAMRKGTKIDDIKGALRASHQAGIRNIVFIMFGFPGETRERAVQTIEFLKANREHIDLVSTSVFGLQKGSYICSHPAEFGITSIEETKRTILDERITFTCTGSVDAERFRKGYRKTLRRLNRLPTVFNYFKEQALVWEDKGKNESS